MEAAPVAKESATTLVAPPSPRSLPPHCPLREPETMAAFKQAVRAGSNLSLLSQRFLLARGEQGAGEFVTRMMDVSRDVFQPWSMEILFLAGIRGEVRFSELESTLGASSRTLSNKLRTLVGAGLLERRVEPGPPVRIAYRLTKSGRTTVAIASPLFAHLNLVAVQGA